MPVLSKVKAQKNMTRERGGNEEEDPEEECAEVSLLHGEVTKKWGDGCPLGISLLPQDKINLCPREANSSE